MAKKNKKQLEEELNRYGREYEIAKRKGDRQGMAAAHAKANQTRKQAGWTYDKKSGKTFEKVSPIQKQGRLVNSSQNIALAKSGANPVKAVKQQPTKDRVLTGSQGKALSKSYADKKQQKQELKNVSEKVKESWEKDRVRRKRNENTAKVNQFFANAAKAQGKPIKQLPQSPAMTAQEVSRSLPAIKQIEKDLYDTRIRKEQMVKELPKAEQALRAAAHGLVGSLASAGETAYISARDQVSQWKDFGSDYFTTPLSKLEQNWKEKYADNTINPYGFASQNMRESQYLRDLAVRDMGKVGTFLTDTGISIAQNAPSMALSALNPLAGAAVMGTSAAGAKAYELQQQGISAHDALSRGLAAGAIEGVTEKFSIDHFLKALNNGGLKNTVKNIARQAGVEASEESASYVLNYLADKVAQDPNAAFSMEALLQNAAGGALSGGVFGGAGSVAGAFRPAVSQSSPMGASKSSSFDIADFQIPADTFSERNYQHSAPKNQHIPDFEAQWNRYNQMGQNGVPFENVPQYETATPIDYETAFSAHAAGLNDYKARAMEVADRIINLETMDSSSMDLALSEPQARTELSDAIGTELPDNYKEARTMVRNWQSKELGLAPSENAFQTARIEEPQALGDLENEQKNNASGETQYSLKRTPNGETYWEIDTEADIFRDIKGYKELKTKAYEYLLNGDKGRRIETLIDGEALEFRRISANEYIYGRQSKTLGKKEFNQKMRMAPSIPDLIENAAVTWDAPDMKNHKLFPNGFKNYRGRVGIDETIFNYIVRVGKAVNGQVFYDINLEADNSVPSARKHVSDASVPSASKRVSDVKVSASDSSIVQNQSAGNPQTQTVTQMQQTPVTARQTGVIQNEAVRTVDKHTADTIDRIAKRTGFSVEFVQGVPEAGSYQDGKIRINTESGDPVQQIFVHELTHYLEQSGEYHTLADAIANNLEHSQVDTSVLKRQIINEYAKNGVVLSEDGANREMIAKYAESYLFADASSIQRLAQENRSLVQKIRDWLHDLRVKLRGTAEEKFILRTEKLYQKALNSVNGQKNNASGETQYSFSEQKIPSYEELIAKPDIPVVDIRGRGEGRIAEQRKQFLNSPEAHKLYEAPVINRDTGEPVFITPHTLQHTFSNIGFAQINAGKNLAKIIENAVLTHTESITHKNQNALAIFTLFGAVRTEQGIQPIKLKVKEYRIGKQRLPAMIQSYFDKNGAFEPYASAYDGRVLELESIEKEEVSSSALPTLVAEATQGEHPSTSSYIRVADLYDLVNSEYQKYLPQKEQGNPAYAQGSSFDKLLRDAGYKKQADALKKAVKQYGTYEHGEYAARNVQIPKQMNDETRVSRFSRTAAEASVLTDEQAGEIGKAVAEGRFDYEPIPDEAARAHAESIMERGESAAQNVWDRIVNSTHSASKKDIAVGEYLLKQAAEAGDTQRVVELAAQIAAEGTRAGQIVQAMRMLKKLDGAGQAIALDTTLKKLQAELDSNQKNKTFLEVPPELRERLVAAKGEQQVGEVMDEIYQNIADQLPVRWSDKWNAWRYLSMLGNPRTHIRNVLGNTAFAPVVGVKNVIGTVLESAVQNTQRLAGKEGITRTKTISGNIPFTGGKTRAFAIRDFAEVQDILKGGGKMNPSDIIREKQSVFKFKPLAYLQQMNFNLLEAEDAMFLKSHYVRAMVQFMNSNKVNMEIFSPETNKKDAILLHKARDYAIKEAQKATYRDFSQAAQAISQMSRNSGNLGSVFIEGVLPFKKTPINVLKRGVEYSPVGLLETVTIGTKKLASGQINGNEFIDRLSAGLTGTGISILGFLLSKLGYVDGSLGDEKDEKFRKSLGAQPYAIKIGNQSYTIDWLAPASMPFFVGAEMQRVAEELEGLNGRVIWDSAMNIMEPMTKMSMLDGLNGAISAVRYGEDPLSDLFTNAVIDYIGQAVPTLFGQIARTIDDTGRSTYIDKNSGVPDVMQKAFQKNRNKIPLLSQQSVAYRDVFGRAQSNPSMVSRAFQNMLSPGFLSQEKVGAMEQEMIRVYQATKDGEHCPIPSNAPKSFEVDKKTKYLTAEEYEKFAYSRGALMYSSLNELTQSKGYQGLDDANKAKAAKKVISYATAAAKMEVSDYKPTGEYAKAIQAWKEQKISFAQYALIQSAMPDKGLTDKNGESIQNSKSLLMMDTLWNTPGLSEKQREYLYEDFKVSKKTRHYNKALVAQTLDKMRRE